MRQRSQQVGNTESFGVLGPPAFRSLRHGRIERLERSLQIRPGVYSQQFCHGLTLFQLRRLANLILCYREPDNELTAPANALALRFDATSMEFHQSFDQRQSDAHAALGTIPRGIVLREQVEDL